METLRNGCRFCLDDGLHPYLADLTQNCPGDRFLMNIRPNIFVVIHEGAPFCRRGDGDSTARRAGVRPLSTSQTFVSSYFCNPDKPLRGQGHDAAT